MTVHLVVNLWNSKINDRNLFTVDSQPTPNIDKDNKNPNFAYRNKFTSNPMTVDAILYKTSKHIHAIAIMYKKSYAFL